MGDLYSWYSKICLPSFTGSSKVQTVVVIFEFVEFKAVMDEIKAAHRVSSCANFEP